MKKLETILIHCLAIILFATACIKVLSSYGTSQFLSMRDPVLSLSTRHTLILAGVVELLIACYLVVGRKWEIKILSTLWLGLVFVTYRWWLHYIAPNKPCSCLGSLTDWLSVNQAMAERLSLSIIIFMFVATILLFALRKLDSTAMQAVSNSKDL